MRVHMSAIMMCVLCDHVSGNVNNVRREDLVGITHPSLYASMGRAAMWVQEGMIEEVFKRNPLTGLSLK